jgi:hypothetical protein
VFYHIFFPSLIRNKTLKVLHDIFASSCGIKVKKKKSSRWWSSGKNLGSRGLPSSSPVVAHMMAHGGLHDR